MANIKERPILPLLSIVAHCILAIGAASSSGISKLWAASAIFIGLYQIIKHHNRNDEAAQWSAYMAGLEVVLRGTGGSLLWELGKYSIILFLTIGIAIDRRHSYKPPLWIFLVALLLIPGILTTFAWSDRAFEDISFNISGIACLLVSTYYFTTRRISSKAFKLLMRYYLLPVISLAFVLFYKTPDLSTIHFSTKANFATSGGFGPNQVASILGMGWLLVLILVNKKEKVTKSALLTYAILGFLVFRSLLTFSRGGNLAAILAYITFICIYVKAKDRTIISFSYLRNIVIISIFATFLIGVLNNVTDGMFENRFLGKNSVGMDKEDITAGRMNLLEEEYALFKESPLGTGAGGSMYFRTIKFGNNLASHNEFGRLLSEHGIFGIIIIILLISQPILYYRKQKNIDIKALGALFFVISICTAMHSAFRLAMPAFFYGISFMQLYKNEN